ncbi:prepilin peptidase [Chloroflexota bacterium]
MEITLTIIFALLGIAVGSFLNVCIDRLPGKKSLVYPPSHCDTCQHPLSPIDLIPIISYLWLRGRCRFCHSGIPLRPLLVELIGGTLFAFAYWHFGLSAELAVTLLFSSIFIVLGFIDWEHQLILNRITYPAAVAALIISIFQHPPGIINIALPWSAIAGGVNGIINSIIGGAIGFAFFLIVILINPRGMGWGDVKLAGLIGLVMGFRLVFVALFIGIISGGVYAIILLSMKKKGRKDVVPYGSFLVLGPIIAMLWGNDILAWYLGFFQP